MIKNISSGKNSSSLRNGKRDFAKQYLIGLFRQNRRMRWMLALSMALNVILLLHWILK